MAAVIMHLTGSWRWIFVVMAGAAVIGQICMGAFFDETLSSAGVVATPIEDMKKVFCDRYQVALFAAMVLAYSSFFTEYTSETYIVQDWYGRSSIFYGVSELVYGGVFLLGVPCSG